MNFKRNIIFDKRDMARCSTLSCSIKIRVLLKLFNLQEWEDYNVVRLCSYTLALIMFSFNVFIYCYMGEQIIEQVSIIEPLFIIEDNKIFS